MSWEESTRQKMLHLKLPTDPRWVRIAEMQIEDILVDHAYCEQKAASSCISLILRFADMDELVDTLTPIVAEEWGHFERVLEQLRKRGMKFGFPRKDEYVIQLNGFVVGTDGVVIVPILKMDVPFFVPYFGILCLGHWLLLFRKVNGELTL